MSLVALYTIMIMLSSHQQFAGLLQILRRDRILQIPGNVHRLFAFMLYISRRTKIGIRFRAAIHLVGFELTHKQQHLAALLPVVDVSLSRR